MATVNFSIPEEIKEQFNAAFAHKNKSAVIAGLMKEAVEREKLALTRAEAIDRLLALRDVTPPVGEEEIRIMRGEGRP